MKLTHSAFLILLLFISHSKVQSQNSNQTYRIGYFHTPPLCSQNEDGQPEGLAVDLINEVARINGFQVEWHYDEFSKLMQMMQNQELDALPSVGYSNARAEFLTYSQQNFTNVWGQVFLPANANVDSLLDLGGKVTGILKDGVNGINFQSQCEQFEVDCEYHVGSSYLELFTMVSNGQLDAAVSNNLVGYSMMNELGLHSSNIIFNPFKVFVTIPRGEPRTFLTQFDQTLAVWKNESDSFYYQSRKKWLNPEETNLIPTWLFYSLLGLILFSGVAFVAAVLFKKQVNRRATELSQRDTQFNQIVNIIPHLIYANDKSGQVILANENACQFLGIDPDKAEQQNIYDVLKSSAYFENLLPYATSSNPFNTELEVQNHKGEVHTLMMSKVPYSGQDLNKPAEVTVGVDISQLKAYENEIQYLAHFDGLTDLPNRELFNERLKANLIRASEHDQVGAIVYIDLDNFKSINDSQGHKVGDKLIKKVANRIQMSISMSDTVARMGGDDFAIIMPELSTNLEAAKKQTLEQCHSMIEKIQKPIQIEGKHYHITASVGVAIYPKDGDRKSVLLQRADTAMNEAKFRGRNRTEVFDKSMEARVKKAHQLENDLRKALENKEIFLVFQPVYEATTKQMVGSEALLRWRHPTEGVIMPDEFIPIAEKAQLIMDMGYWTIDQACQEILQWQKQSEEPFFIAVNLSVIQFRDEEFFDRVTAMISEYQIPHQCLEFEVTESILLSESQRAIEIIKQLKMLGIKLSIDDFGTGYSSFDYIRKLPVDKIKIDKSFITEIPHDTNSTTIVKTIMGMANELNLDVVAEGIEHPDQVEFLQNHGCQYYQGYYFSKPKELDQIFQQINN